MTDREFKSLLKRYQKGQASKEEAERVNLWLDACAKQDMFNQLSTNEKQEIKRSLFIKLDKQLEHSDPWRWKQYVYGFGNFGKYRIAAISLLLLLVSIGIWQMLPDDSAKLTITISTRVNEVKKVILGDGSIVWLKGNSTLIYPEEFTGVDRLVRLEGEGLFEVRNAWTSPSSINRLIGEKPEKKSFIVLCGNTKTKVLGTSFTIQKKNDETVILVLTGKVAVSSSLTNQTIELLPKETGIYSHNKKHFKKVGVPKGNTLLNNQNDKITQYITGTEYNMRFDNSILRNVTERISNKFDVRIQLAKALDSCLIRADFTGQSLSNTLEMITEVLNASYEIKDDIIYVKGTGCN